MKTIPVASIPGIRIGQVEDCDAATGVTAIIAPEGMAAGIDVRGGGPASRDTRTLDALAAAEQIHAVLLAGGSAFGLDAAGGAMRYLEEHGIGLEVGPVRVPLVCQSGIFDLGLGSADVRPDAQMGYAACAAAETGNYRDGSYGAGCGATVGKIAGPQRCMKGGIGSYAVQVGRLQVGAVVVVNAIGDIVDPRTGQRIAGVLAQDRRSLASTEELMYAGYEAPASASGQTGAVTNTTIGAIITNAQLPKAQLCKVAGMGHDGMARAIRPVHTSMDGDSLYALSAGNVEASADIVGTLAAHVVEQAILVATRSAQSSHGVPAARDLR